jgi:serine/threonine-protein kinase
MGQEASGSGDASNANAWAPQPGEVVAGKFVVEHLLGVGGMGIVVAARHTHLDQTVAIKLLRREAAEDEAAVNRFLREARAVAILQSEHVVRVMDAGRLDDGLPYLVMEHLSGMDLDQLLVRRGQLPLEEAVGYLLQAMEAVAEAHAVGIVHRDLKPSNLFVTTGADGAPFVKVLDFGISKAIDSSATSPLSLTATSMTLGSPLYMSPEQVRDSKTVDARTDVWALGIIAYELLAGAQPFEADTVTGLCAKIVADEPATLRSIRPDVPVEFEAVVRRCLEKNLASRYQSVGELAAALRPFATADGRASVTRIGRISGSKATLISAQDPGKARESTPSAPRAAAPGEADIGYAETVAPWQTTGSAPRRGTKAAVLALAGLALAVCAIIAMKWRADARPAVAAAPAASAAALIEEVPAAVTPEVATLGVVPLPVAPAPSPEPATAPVPSSQLTVRHPVVTAVPVKATKPVAGAAPPVKTTDDLLRDRK